MLVLRDSIRHVCCLLTLILDRIWPVPRLMLSHRVDKISDCRHKHCPMQYKGWRVQQSALFLQYLASSPFYTGAVCIKTCLQAATTGCRL